MPSKDVRLNTIVSWIFLALSIACFKSAMGQDEENLTKYQIVIPPLCTNNRGETVRFIDQIGGRSQVASGMAIRDGTGAPVIFRLNFNSTPPDFQKFIDRHECAHHQTGDVDRPYPPRNSPTHLMNESISDCVAILRLRDEESYDRDAFNRVADAMRNDMAKIGFPEISIRSRISNINNCFTEYGSPQDFIDGILRHRGLSQP